MAKSKKRKSQKIIRRILLLITAALLLVGIYFLITKVLFPPCEHVHGADGKCTLCGEEYPHEYEEGYCKLCGGIDPDFVFPDEIIPMSVICGGDVMAHNSNLVSAYNGDGSYFYSSYTDDWMDFESCKTDGTFDFSDNYKWVKPYVEKADLALINLETTFSSDGDMFSGSWYGFSAPDSLAKTLKDTGFDVIFTCNNHSLDYGGIWGLQRTVEVLKNNGLKPVGSRKNVNDSRSIITEVNGVKVGIVAYTYETGQIGDWRTLNGAVMADGAWNYLNSYRYDYDNSGMVVCSEDKQAIADEIDWCRRNGAEIIITFFHWDTTNEYVLEVTNLQSDLARFAAENGADIVLGSHPHRVQEMEILSLTDRYGRKKDVPVYYSLGNFVSNQRFETMDYTPYDNPYATEQEIFAYLELNYNRTKGIIEFDKIKAIPLYLDKYADGGWQYRVIPLVGDYQSNEDLGISGNVWRADYALECITDLLGSAYIFN